MAVANALQAGRLTRPEACSACGVRPAPRRDGRSRIEAHHHKGYAREHWLDVEWLCTPCHQLADAAQAEGGSE